MRRSFVGRGFAASTRIQWTGIGDRRSFVYLTGVLFLAYLATGLWSPLLSVYVQSLGAGPRDIGLVLSIFQASSLLSQLWWGRWSDRMGRRKPLLLLGLAGLVAAFVLIATSPHWTWLLLVRVLEGVALAAYSNGSLALIGDLLEDQRERGRLMGLYRTFGSLAFSAAALSGGWLADTIGIRWPLLLAAVCYALAFALGTRIHERPASRPNAETAPPGNVAESQPGAYDRRTLLPFLSMVFTWAFAMGAVVLLWPVYMQGIGYSKTAVGGLWALAALGEAPCFILAGYLADRWGRKRVLLIGLACMATVYFGYTVATALAWMIAVQLLRSFAYASFEAPALLLATELGLRRQRGRLASFYYTAVGAGGILGPIVGGALAQEVGLPAMYRIVVVAMLLVVLSVGWLIPRRALAARNE